MGVRRELSRELRRESLIQIMLIIAGSHFKGNFNYVFNLINRHANCDS